MVSSSFVYLFITLGLVMLGCIEYWIGQQGYDPLYWVRQKEKPPPPPPPKKKQLNYEEGGRLCVGQSL